MRHFEPKFFKLDGNRRPVPCTGGLMEWARWLESVGGERHVAMDQVGDFDVSTVFLGIDHRLVEAGSPVLFETMIFGRRSDELERRQWRCSTWKGAEKQHAMVVKMLREKVLS